MVDPQPLRTALAQMADRHRDELGRLIEVPSISAQGTGIDEAVAVVVDLFESRGFKATVHQTGGCPVVTATGGASDAPVMLFYEHYDVQPPEPVIEWTSPPFELTERDGKLYGRGVADTKGHLICRLAAIDAIREVYGADQIGYKFVVEGEEEIGSPNLEAFIAEHADELAADACIWEFGGVDHEGQPVISLGLKGVLSVELEAVGPSFDAHSSLGAVIDNPLYKLSAAIASLRDQDGRVTIDGFYDDVVPLTEAERRCIEESPDHTDRLRKLYGVERFFGDAKGPELARRLETEPCVNVNGITGGYSGPGAKTVLPSQASAKLDIRLVPDQSPDRVLSQLRDHLDARGFTDVEISGLAGEAPGRTPLDDPFVAQVLEAARIVYGGEPVVQVSNPGSGPAHPFREHLKVPFVCMGCAHPGSRVHAPNEHIRIDDFDQAKLHTAVVLAMFGADA